MESLPELPSAEETVRKFEHGTLDKLEFLNALRALDQSTPERAHAAENIAILERPAIKAIFQDTEEHPAYLNLLSLSYTHVAQQLAANSIPEAAENFRHAYECVVEESRVNPKSEYLQGWIDYVEGNLAYLKNDFSHLQTIVTRMTEEGRNKDILIAFLDGLRMRGAPDFLADLARAKR